MIPNVLNHSTILMILRFDFEILVIMIFFYQLLNLICEHAITHPLTYVTMSHEYQKDLNPPILSIIDIAIPTNSRIHGNLLLN